MSNKTKTLCSAAMLTALSVVLGIFSVRIGLGIKISFKFLPVFLSAVLFGPLWAGLCGALSDILAYIVNPVGSFLPQITIVEFLYGVSYGIFLYKANSLNRTTACKAVGCILTNAVLLSTFAMAYVLKDLMGMGYWEMLLFRLPSVAVNTLLQFFGIFLTLKILQRTNIFKN